MDKLEYIPGDLVKFATNTYTIVNFEENFLHNKICYALISTNSTKTALVAGRDILPIPLTPEILEKNGWEPTKESLGHSFKNKKYPRFALWSINDKWNFTIDGVTVCNTLSCLCYVHELQHLLFGLGLNSEIEV